MTTLMMLNNNNSKSEQTNNSYYFNYFTNNKTISNKVDDNNNNSIKKDLLQQQTRSSQSKQPPPPLPPRHTPPLKYASSKLKSFDNNNTNSKELNTAITTDNKTTTTTINTTSSTTTTTDERNDINTINTTSKQQQQQQLALNNRSPTLNKDDKEQEENEESEANVCGIFIVNEVILEEDDERPSNKYDLLATDDDDASLAATSSTNFNTNTDFATQKNNNNNNTNNKTSSSFRSLKFSLDEEKLKSYTKPTRNKKPYRRSHTTKIEGHELLGLALPPPPPLFSNNNCDDESVKRKPVIKFNSESKAKNHLIKSLPAKMPYFKSASIYCNDDENENTYENAEENHINEPATVSITNKLPTKSAKTSLTSSSSSNIYQEISSELINGITSVNENKTNTNTNSNFYDEIPRDPIYDNNVDDYDEEDDDDDDDEAIRNNNKKNAQENTIKLKGLDIDQSKDANKYSYESIECMNRTSREHFDHSVQNEDMNHIDDEEMGPGSAGKEYRLNYKIYLLQEELIRVKLLLDQSQNMRKMELEKMQKLQEKQKKLNEENNPLNESRIDPTLSVNNHVKLISQITKLQASEKMLRRALDNERAKVNLLNEQLLRLNQKIHESELNDSLDSPKLKEEFRYETLNNKNETTSKKSDGAYFEILEKLKSQGFDENEENNKDIVIYLYQQRAQAVKQLNEILFYMKQMQINCDNPLSGMKKLFADIKSYQNEISYLKQKKDSLKMEMNLQQEGYSKQITRLLEDLNTLKAYHSSNLVDESMNNSGNKPSKTLLNNSSSNANADSAIDDDSLSQNVYTSTAILNRTKTVTIPSHESTDFYVIETESLNESYKKIDKANQETVHSLNEANHRHQEEIKLRDLKIVELERKLTENKLQIDELSQKLEQVKKDKGNLENELSNLHLDLKSYQTDNLNLASKYEQKLQHMNDQLQLFQNENAKYLSENNELRLTKTKNNTELTQVINNYEDRISQLNTQINNLKSLNEDLRYESEKLQIKNEEFLEVQSRNLNDFNKKSAIYEKQIHALNKELSKSKIESDNLKIEHQEIQLKQNHCIHDLKDKINNYEEEIMFLNKDLTKLRVEAQNYKLDYELKSDEVNRLQKIMIELNEMREKLYESEQKLNFQIKANQSMEDKLVQLQNELIAKGFEASLNQSNISDPSSDNIIDSIKHIIQQQLALKNDTSKGDIEELRYKIHDLQMKLSYERLQNESLEIKFKLVDEDNKNLRECLRSHSKKYQTTERTSQNRQAEINLLIEEAQKKAQELIANNPSITSIYDFNGRTSS